MADEEDSEAHKHFLDGKAKYDSGDYNGALGDFEQTLNAPDMRDDLRPDIWLFRAFCWLHLGEWALADDAAAQAGDANQAAYMQKRADLGGGIQPSGQSDSVAHQWYLHGMSQYHAGDYSGAASSFDASVNSPDITDDAKSGVNLVHAICLLYLGAYDRADELAADLSSDDRASYDTKKTQIERENSMSHQWYLYGKSQYDSADYEGALRSFDEALAQPDMPTDARPGVYMIRAICLLHLGRSYEADEAAQYISAEDRSTYEAKRRELVPAD